MKKLASIIVTFAAILGVAVGQSPGVYTIMSGGTNNIAYATTNTPANTFAVSEHDWVAITVSSKASANTTGTLTFRFAESLDSTNYETTPKHVIPLTLNSASTVTIVTNIPVYGAATLKWASLENACTNGYATNITVNWRVKSPKRVTR